MDFTWNDNRNLTSKQKNLDNIKFLRVWVFIRKLCIYFARQSTFMLSFCKQVSRVSVKMAGFDKDSVQSRPNANRSISGTLISILFSTVVSQMGFYVQFKVSTVYFVPLCTSLILLRYSLCLFVITLSVSRRHNNLRPVTCFWEFT